MGEKKLTTEVQIFIVQQFALFEKPQVVADKVREIFEIDLALPSVIYYDITNPKLPKKWKKIFEATRKKFLENVSDIPIANKSFRLRELDRLYHRQKGSKVENPIEARATLEQAAKESGDAFTNRRQLNIDVSKLTDEELSAITED